MAETHRHWPKLVAALELEGQVPEHWYTKTKEQRAAAGETLALLDGVFARKSLAEWREIFDAHEVWYQTILTVSTAAAAAAAACACLIVRPVL